MSSPGQVSGWSAWIWSETHQLYYTARLNGSVEGGVEYLWQGRTGGGAGAVVDNAGHSTSDTTQQVPDQQQGFPDQYRTGGADNQLNLAYQTGKTANHPNHTYPVGNAGSYPDSPYRASYGAPYRMPGQMSPESNSSGSDDGRTPRNLPFPNDQAVAHNRNPSNGTQYRVQGDMREPIDGDHRGDQKRSDKAGGQARQITTSTDS